MGMLVKGTEGMGRYGVWEQTAEDQMVVDSAERMGLSVMNTIFIFKAEL